MCGAMGSLKAIGLIASNYIVAVSPCFLDELIKTKSANEEIDYIRKILVRARVIDKRILGIANGYKFEQYCQIGKMIKDPFNIYHEKTKIKHKLAGKLCGTRSEWKINPNLPLLLFVGRFSIEKGIDTFPQIIEAINNKAIFIAFGRGMTDEIHSVITQHSRQTDNVFITFSEEEQLEYIALARAGADFTVVPSHREACGLTQIEGFANGSPCITSGIGGIRDSVKPLDYQDKDNTKGNGIFYEDMPNGKRNPSLLYALNNALEIYSEFSAVQKNAMQMRIIDEAKRFDWLAEGGSLQKYYGVFKSLVNTGAAAIQPPVVHVSTTTPKFVST